MFRKSKNAISKYQEVGKLLHEYHPEIFDIDGNVIGNQIKKNELSFSTAKHTYFVGSSLSFAEFEKLTELENYIEFGKETLHSKAVAALNKINSFETGEVLKVGDLQAISVTLAEICDRSSPEHYKHHTHSILKACTLFIKYENEPEWTENLATQKINDWNTGIITPNIGKDFLFFFGLYEAFKKNLISNANGSFLTSYLRMASRQN